MKAYPIPNGGIHIEMDDNDDWRLIAHLIADARDETYDLADDISANITAGDDLAADWADFVLPDLREQFDFALARVAQTVGQAHAAHNGGPGRVVILQNAAPDWYGVLNRARLALEHRHRFSTLETISTKDLATHGARLRDRLYCALQSLLLDHSFE